MYLSRGNPVVYYGDEQGFTGEGGDQLARQTMFASQVPEYLDDDLIGTTRTHAVDNFETGASAVPVDRAAGGAHDARTRRCATAPSSTATPTTGAGVYAFSRIDREQQREYVVALNNAETAKTAAIPTYTRRALLPARLRRRAGDADERRRRAAGADRPAARRRSSTRSTARSRASKSPPKVALEQPAPAAGRARAHGGARGRRRRRRSTRSRSSRKSGDSDWKPIGTDDNAPYRVFHDVSGLRTGTPLKYRAVVLDNRGHTRSSGARETAVPAPIVTIEAPAEGAKVRGTVQVRATVDPERATHVVAFERSVAGGAWTPIGSDDSSPAYVVFDDISGAGARDGHADPLPRDPDRAGRDDGHERGADGRAGAAAGDDGRAALPGGRRGDYAGWGLHMWGDAVGLGARADRLGQAVAVRPASRTAGRATTSRSRTTPSRSTSSCTCRPGDSVPTTREPGGDRSFVPSATPQVWIKQGDPTV